MNKRDLLRLSIKTSSSNEAESVIRILKKLNLYCSFDQFLWAIGALVFVKIRFWVGKIKKDNLFFLSFLDLIKER